MLFGGDVLAFLSSHYIPACMHRPDGREMARQAPATRLSTPFFLYADRDALFDSEQSLCPKPHLLSQSTLPAADFYSNAANVHELWPWKQEAYYQGRVICRDSDEFPGLEEEAKNVMSYAD